MTQTLVAESRDGTTGTWHEYVGGYSDWVAQRPKPMAPPATRRGAAPTRRPRQGVGQPAGDAPLRARTKLTFAERRELEALPDEIEALEREQHALTERMCRPDYHREGAERMKADRARAEEIEHALAAKFERWGELDGRKGRAGRGRGRRACAAQRAHGPRCRRRRDRSASAAVPGRSRHVCAIACRPATCPGRYAASTAGRAVYHR